MHEEVIGALRHSSWLAVGLLALSTSCGSSRDSARDPGRGGAKAGSGTGGSSDGGAGSSEVGAGTDASGGAPDSGGPNDGSGGTAAAGRANQGAGGTRSNAPEDQAGAAGEASTTVHGVVIDIATQRPLAGRRVVFAPSLADGSGEEVTTDATGAFTFDRPGRVYDAAVVETDGSAVTIYTELHAGELVLPHRWDGRVAATEFATISGTVSGGATFPLEHASDIVAVNLFSNAATDRYLMGGGSSPYGPEYATGTSFDASGTSPATLVALGTFGRTAGDASEPAYTAFAATKELSLVAGDAISLDLTLQPVALREIAGTATTPDGRTLTGVLQQYRFPYPEAALSFPSADIVRQNPLTNDGAFAFELPELEQGGAKLCLAAVSEGDGELWTERCSLEFDADSVSLELQAAPTLLAPIPGDIIDPTTRFTWSAFDAGIHYLELRPASAPSPTTPFITLFTAATEAVIPPLSALHASLPEDTAYRVDVVGLGPYASLDEALGPEGVGTLIPHERRRSTSSTVEVSTPPP